MDMQAQMELLGGAGGGSGSESQDRGTHNAKQHIFWI